MSEKIYILCLQITQPGDLMFKNDFPGKRLKIAAVTAILMLLLAGCCAGQSHPGKAGAGSCRSCSKSIFADQTAAEAPSLPISDNVMQEIDSTNPFKMQPGNSSPLSPAGLISDPRPIFNWTAAYNATRYNLQVYNNNSFAANNSIDAGEFLVANEWFDAKKVTLGGFCSEFLSVNLLDGVYFWHVQACNAEGCGNWSRWQYFENICAFKPDASGEKMNAVEEGMMPEKTAIQTLVEAGKEMIRAKKTAAQEKRIAFRGGEKGVCNSCNAD
ncbi:MAG TPA: hypothetical protein PKY20_00115 [Methanothrix sp.]|nr:hypothetical protein [Methanothrix sp.]